MKMPTVKLGEICEINPVTDCQFGPEEACCFVPMEAVDDIDACIRRMATRPFCEVAKGYTIFAENDVIVAKITPCMENGKCAIARGLPGGLAFGSTEFHVLRPTQQVLPEWLYYFWRFPSTRKLAAISMTGSAGQKRVPVSFLESADIPLPDLLEQRRIAGQLEEADRLRRTRRYVLELIETFLSSAFLQLFGDPVRNLPGFNYVKLGDDLECIESGFSPVCEGPRVSVDQWAILGLGAVTTGIFKPSENKRLPHDVSPRPKLEVHDGDVLVTRKNTYDLVAACALVRNPPQRLLLPDTIFRFHLRRSSKLNPVFLWGLLSFPSFREQVQGLASGSAGSMPGISKNKFMNINCPVPPMALQQKFAAVVERVECLRAVQREALRQTEHLFASLLERAFSE